MAVVEVTPPSQECDYHSIPIGLTRSARWNAPPTLERVPEPAYRQNSGPQRLAGTRPRSRRLGRRPRPTQNQRPHPVGQTLRMSRLFSRPAKISGSALIIGLRSIACPRRLRQNQTVIHDSSLCSDDAPSFHIGTTDTPAVKSLQPPAFPGSDGRF